MPCWSPCFLAYLYHLVAPHVPSRDPKMIMFFGASCAACMSGVFWLAVQMFRVVLKAPTAGEEISLSLRSTSQSPAAHGFNRALFLCPPVTAN